jgi:hypothetical protein
MAMTIRMKSAIGFIGLQATNTVGYICSTRTSAPWKHLRPKNTPPHTYWCFSSAFIFLLDAYSLIR